MISALNPLRLLEPRSGVQVYPPPGQAAANRRLNLSLFQYCSLVRSRLERDHVFARFLNQVASEPNFDSSDPVSHLWDCFCIGLPLCYLYNRVIGTLPRRHAPLDVDREQTITQSLLEAERAKTEAVAMFCMGVTELNPEWSLGVSDIVNDRVSLDGFMKVLFVVDSMLDILPHNALGQGHPMPMIEVGQPADRSDSHTRALWHQLIISEHAYVRDLDRLQAYADAIKQHTSPTVVERMFPTLNQLVNFQRWFCIHIETIASLPKEDQRLGMLFVDNEVGFAQIYEPYCANVANTADIILVEESRLARFNSLIDVRNELPALILKPSNRIYSYPILLESLLKCLSPEDPSYEDLEQGRAAMIRVVNKVNKRQRKASTDKVVENLSQRVKEWDGLNVAELGDLLLVDVLTVLSTDELYEAHVFLFDDSILCFWDSAGLPPISSSRKLKRGGLNTRRKRSGGLGSPPVAPAPRLNNTESDLILKHRVRLSEVVFVTPSIDTGEGEYVLVVSSRREGGHNSEQLRLRFRNEHQLKEWQMRMDELVDDYGANADTASSRYSWDTDAHSMIPDLRVEPAESIISDRQRKTLSVRSHVTTNSAEEHIISYYFSGANGMLSPAYSARGAFSLNSRHDSGEYDTTSILDAYQRNRTPSPSSHGSSPGSERLHSSPSRMQEQDALQSPVPSQFDANDDQYKEDLAFMQTVLKLEETDNALTSQRGSSAANSLDLLQEILDRADYFSKLDFLDQPQLDGLSDLRQSMRRILLKLARDADILPPSLFISGLHIPRIDRAVCLGGFADIYLGTYKGEAVAVKRLRIIDEEVSQNKSLWKETIIWRQLKHPNVLKFIGVDQETFHPHTCMVSSWLPHGNVISYLKREGPENVDVDRILLEIALGMEYLHLQGVIHGDLRGSNILVDNGHHARLADFGLGSMSESTAGSTTAKGAGSIRWMAPELLRSEVEFQRTPPTDVYSYGCVCIELYTCSRPYAKVPLDMQVFFHVVNSGWRPSRPTVEECLGPPMPDRIWSIAESCWAEDPPNRLYMSDVVVMLSRTR